MLSHYLEDFLVSIQVKNMLVTELPPLHMIYSVKQEVAI